MKLNGNTFMLVEKDIIEWKMIDKNFGFDGKASISSLIKYTTKKKLDKQRHFEIHFLFQKN